MTHDDYDYDDDDDETRAARESKLQNSNIWVSIEDGQYTTAHGVVATLPPGAYEIRIVMGQAILARIDTNTETLTRFADQTYDGIMRDMERFWEARDRFAKHGIAYKRGILLHGPPGTGKSCIVRLIVEDVTARGGVAVKFGDVTSYITGMHMLRKVAPKMPVVVVMEDVETLLRYDESTVLNVLDGMYGIDGVVYLATTNHVEQLQERIKNRPSRFDKRLFIDCPTPSVRREYIERIDVTESLTGDDVTRWVDDSEGFSFAHIKELYVSTILFENAYDDVLGELRAMYLAAAADGRRIGDEEHGDD